MMGRPLGRKDTVRRGIAHCFARQFLKDHKIRIYRGDEQILNPVEKLYSIKLPNTRYFVGEQFSVVGELVKILSYEILKEKGFVIVSRSLAENEKWDYAQRVVYDLRRIEDAGDKFLSNFPKDHHAEFDPYNKALRLVGKRTGPLGYGPWTLQDPFKKKRDAKNPQEYGSRRYIDNAREVIHDQLEEWLGIEPEPEPVYIKECAFMITDSNEIVCLPNLPDMPSILITGMKGVGKSFTLHSLVSRLFWKPAFDFKIVILNDSSRETGTWCFPNEDELQIKTLRKLNERPLPLPTVYLHPMVKEDYEKLYMGTVGFDITIPFMEIVENAKDYLKMEGSARYFARFKEDLLKLKTQEEVEAFIDNLVFTHKVPPQTKNKIQAEFDTLFDAKMTDISSKKQFPWTTSLADDTPYNPLTACVQAGVVPILETEYVSNRRELLSIYFTFFVKDLFNRQKQDAAFIKQRSELMLVIDEAHNISQKGINSPADFLLRRCVREGRPRRIGTMLATQKFIELPDVIKDNSTYLICFKNPGEAAKIANQYKMGKGIAETITNLKKHQCVSYTTEYFIVYDSNGNRRKSKPNEVFVGRALPPFSLHKRPRKKSG